MKGIAIIGSTGSIGTSALDVLSGNSDRFRLVALAAGRNLPRLCSQIRQFRPALVSVQQPEDITTLRQMLSPDELRGLEIIGGEQGAQAVAGHPDVSWVLTAMVGSVGLRPTLTAIERGITVAIANKEPLVMAGELCTETARHSGATLLPVDSEHSAIFQCLQGQQAEDVRRLLLTCSGGPFRQVNDLSAVTVEQALQHPTWSMGPKITIDSATLINKALEVIEAHWLFGLPAEMIEVVIHPQSVIHSMVEYVDGAVVAQLGTPDMRVPIAYALGYPRRLPLELPPVDWVALGGLTFEAPDHRRFPALDLGREALRAGGTAPAVLNAANEVAVEAFLAGRIGYARICDTIRRTLDQHQLGPAKTLPQVLAADQWARTVARSVVAAEGH